MPLLSLPLTKIIDISAWQDDKTTLRRIDFTKPLRHNIRCIMNRAVFSTTRDIIFDYNWIEERRLGYIRGVYGFWDYRPGNPGVEIQAKSLVSILKNDPGEFPVVWMDVERPLQSWPKLPSPRTVLASMKQYALIIEAGLSGKICGYYINGAMIKYLMSDPIAWIQYKSFITSRPLWIAAWPDWLNPNNQGKWKVLPGESLDQYIFRTGWIPNIYNQWNKWLIWQYGTPTEGLKYGMESREVDADFFNGTMEELYRFCGLGVEIDPKPPVEPDNPDEKEEEEDMLKMEVITDNLNVRSGPDTSYQPAIRAIHKSDIVPVYDIAGKRGAWVRIDPFKEEWCCVQNPDGIYLRKVG
jgi:hypothetical protein